MSATQISTDGPGLNMTEIFAPFYWGFVISLFLGGITIVQAYIYFPTHPTENPSRSSLLDLVSSALIAQSLFYYLIPHYGSLAQLGSVTTELNVECLLNATITFISQMYFAYQIHMIKRNDRVAWFVIVVITVCAIFAFVGGIGCITAMAIFQHGVLSNRNEKFAVESQLIFFRNSKGFGTVTDIVATVAMCIYLWSSKTGIAQTKGLIKSLIQYVINRGIVVTLLQTLLLVLFYAAPNKLYWIAAHINVTKLYANTFFAMLNARERIKQKHAGSKAISTSFFRNISDKSDKSGKDQTFSPSHDTAEAQDKPYEMPTVAKAVVIADL